MKRMRWISSSSCGGCGLNRRSFLQGCLACAAGGAGSRQAKPTLLLLRKHARPKIGLVFSQVPMPQPTWPYIGFDFEPRKREVIELLKQGCPNVEFLPVTIQSAEDAKKVLADDKVVDGYLVHLLGIWSGGVMPIASSGKPTLLVDYLFGGSGEFLISYAAARRNNSTSRAFHPLGTRTSWKQPAASRS